VLQAANKYYLDIKLPYKVNSDEGSAKFDSKLKTLTVTLPTVKEEIVEEEKPKQVEEVEEIGAKQEEEKQERNEDTEEENSNSTLKFVTEESQRKYREGKQES